MDGFIGSFISDERLLSEADGGLSGNILYMEDLDASPVDAGSRVQVETQENEPAIAGFAQEDMDRAYQRGYEEGASVATADAHLLQAQLDGAAIQNLADVLIVAQSDLRRLTLRQATEIAKTILALMQAAIPATMAQNADLEIDALLAAFLPNLSATPELRVRTHADHVERVRDALIGKLPSEDCILLVSADNQLALGDIQVSWADGKLRRSTQSCWNDIRNALAPLGLPTLEETCNGSRR